MYVQINGRVLTDMAKTDIVRCMRAIYIGYHV